MGCNACPRSSPPPGRAAGRSVVSVRDPRGRTRSPVPRATRQVNPPEEYHHIAWGVWITRTNFSIQERISAVFGGNRKRSESAYGNNRPPERRKPRLARIMGMEPGSTMVAPAGQALAMAPQETPSRTRRPVMAASASPVKLVVDIKQAGFGAHGAPTVNRTRNVPPTPEIFLIRRFSACITIPGPVSIAAFRMDYRCESSGFRVHPR
jgi:hypothetical protein